LQYYFVTFFYSPVLYVWRSQWQWFVTRCSSSQWLQRS